MQAILLSSEEVAKRAYRIYESKDSYEAGGLVS